MKKILVSMMAITLLAMPFANTATPVSAASTLSGDCEECQGANVDELIAQLEEDGTTTNMEPGESVVNELDHLVSEKDADYAMIFDQLETEGYTKEEETSSYISFKNLKDDEKVYEHVGIVTEFYIKNENKLAQKAVWVDLANDEVIRYEFNKVDTTLAEDFQVQSLASYDVKQETSNTEGSGQFQTADFTFNGISFACGASGLLACTAATGGLAVFIPAAGVAASLACNAAFLVGCSFT